MPGDNRYTTAAYVTAVGIVVLLTVSAPVAGTLVGPGTGGPSGTAAVDADSTASQVEVPGRFPPSDDHEPGSQGNAEGVGSSAADDQAGSTSEDDNESSTRSASARYVPGQTSLPAAPETHELRQPNGVAFDARQWGDAWTHGWETTGGYTVTTGPEGYWQYATVERGELAPTGIRVGIDQAPSDASRHVRPDDSPAGSPGADEGGPAPAGATADDGPQLAAPTTGTVQFPVVLMNYDDTAVNYTEGNFQDLLFGTDPAIATGPGSMYDFYDENSNGQLTVTGDVAGWYTADNGHDYYGANSGGFDQNPGELALEAAQKSDPAIDYSTFDNNGDCVVDQFAVVHEGGGEEATGDSTDIWSHKWSISSATGSAYVTDDSASCGDIVIDGYMIQPEEYSTTGEMSTMGVFAHEFGHGFGLPDLYDTDGSSEGLGNWALMAGGSWNADDTGTFGTDWLPGDSPAHMIPWSKEFMGWTSPPSVQNGETRAGATLENATRTNEVQQVLQRSTTAHGEYFQVENRRQVGFDRGLPGAGVMIYHVNRSVRTDQNCLATNDCKADETNKLVDIEAADGNGDLDAGTNRGDTGDPWSPWTEFDGDSTPSSAFDNGTASDVEIGPMDPGAPGDAVALSLSAEDLAPLSKQWTKLTGGRMQYSSVGLSVDTVVSGGLGPDLEITDRVDRTPVATITRSGSLVDSSPTVHRGTAYVGSGGGVLYAVDAATGSVEWTHSADSAIVSDPVVANGMVYVGSNDGDVRAHSTSDGSVQWTYSADAAVYSRLNASGGTVYASTVDGTLLALDAASGTRDWQLRTNTDTGHASPVASGGTVYYAADRLYAVYASNGSVDWSQPISGTESAIPRLGPSTVFVGTDEGTVHAVPRSGGTAAWTYTAGDAVTGQPVLARDRLVFGAEDGRLYALNASTGTATATATLAGTVRSTPVYSGGAVYVGTENGEVIVLAEIRD